jgi:hypothetical protein
MRPWKEEALARTTGSCERFQLKNLDKIVGIFYFYATLKKLF